MRGTPERHQEPPGLRRRLRRGVQLDSRADRSVLGVGDRSRRWAHDAVERSKAPRPGHTALGIRELCFFCTACFTIVTGRRKVAQVTLVPLPRQATEAASDQTASSSSHTCNFDATTAMPKLLIAREFGIAGRCQTRHQDEIFSGTGCWRVTRGPPTGARSWGSSCIAQPARID